MRRLPVVCAVLLVASAGFVAVQKYSGIAFAATQSATDTSGISSTAKATVIATSIPVRAIALDPVDSNFIYLTRADAPTQIFEIQSANVGNATVNSHLAAIAGTTAKGSLGDGGPATSAQLDLSASSLIERSGIAVTHEGALYLADSGNSTIRKVAAPNSTEPGIIRSVAGRWATGQSSALAEPMGLALDQAGNLFIADHATSIVATLSPTGEIRLLAHFASPASIAVTPDGKTAFVASPETGAILAIDPQTSVISSVKGFAAVSNPPPCVSPAPASATVCPAGLAVDASGNLFVSDSNSGRILRVDAQNGQITTFASGLKAPGALAMDLHGNLYAAEQGADRILAFAQVGTSQGSLSLTPTSASFGNEPSGGVTATQSFTLSASNLVTGLNIPKATTPGDFTVQSNSCTATLAANSSCILNVAFTPTTAGARSATLAVTDSNSADSASTVLSGTGDDYQLQLANGQLTSISIQAGAAATFNLQVVPDAVFSGAVAFVCPNNLPTNTTCAFSSPTVNVTPGTPATFSVTFQTTGIVNPLTTWLPFRGAPPNLSSTLLILAIGTSLFWLIRKRALSIGTVVVIVGSIVLFAGCSKGTSPASIGATPAGTYTMAVTGNSQNASRALTITLNVVQK